MTKESMGTVFLIDDDKGMRRKYKTLLKSNGFKVIEAPDALEVVNTLMRNKADINLIVLDIQIPEVDGRDIFEIIEEYAPELPIMVSSVLPLQDQKLRIRRAQEYFQKSDRDEVFISKIKAVLN